MLKRQSILPGRPQDQESIICAGCCVLQNRENWLVMKCCMATIEAVVAANNYVNKAVISGRYNRIGGRLRRFWSLFVFPGKAAKN